MHDYDVKLPNFTFYDVMNVKTGQIFFFWTKIPTFRIQPQKKFINICQLNDVEQ